LKKGSDIDILIIIDDVRAELTAEFVEAYRVIVEKIAFKISKKLHITTLKLTNFWDYTRAGDPIVINMLRDGIPLMDYGFFEPLQILLPVSSENLLFPKPDHNRLICPG
ncbi:MAG: hypothetical protein MUP24_05005, partial [Gillisia sp.]|nr:hypothetical protein [Gillisia sp.]